MKLSKGLKVFSIILECSFIGCIILYIYNYFIASKKYEIMPIEVKKILNVFVIIGIISLILFLIVKFVLYIINRKIYEDVQLQMDLSDPIEKQYKDLEAPVTERVFIYKNEYEVPKSRQLKCPNCGNVIDKNAFICIKCGFLLKEIQPKIIEKIIERPVVISERRIPNQGVIVTKNRKDNLRLTNLIINICLITASITLFILMLYIAAQRGVIG